MNLAAYLALTSHWISLNKSNGHLVLKSALISFYRLKKKHSGVNIAETILHLPKWANITLKVCLPCGIYSLVCQILL
jgi:hypothetical protein